MAASVAMLAARMAHCGCCFGLYLQSMFNYICGVFYLSKQMKAVNSFKTKHVFSPKYILVHGCYIYCIYPRVHIAALMN